MAYAECFVLMLPLRECAWRCRVCLKTAYTMRRRLIECLSAYSPPLVRGRARLFDEGRTRGIGGTVDWARLEAEAGKMIESALEHADSIEAAWDINRVPDSRTPGCLA